MIVSKFNTQELCRQCKKDEEQAPNYRTACLAEEHAVRGGDYNYRGIGLSASDQAFLAFRRRTRREVP